MIHGTRRFAFRLIPLLFSGAGLLAISAFSEESLPNTFLPQPLEDSLFSSLKSQSPFTRTLNLSDSLILTGVATVDDKKVATLLNKETRETFIVSSTANTQGWKMVDLKDDKDLEKVAARISVEGGEVVTVRYAEWQLKPGEAKPGAGGNGGEIRREERRGFSRHGGPPPEIREKISQLTDEQRHKLFEKYHEFRQKHDSLSEDERREVFRKMLDKAAKKK